MTTTGNNYPNPLDDFRSHSYHFVLTVASTTRAFAGFQGDRIQDLLSGVSTLKIGESVKSNQDDIYLVIDTRRFSQFSITSLETTHTFGSGKTGNPAVPLGFMNMHVMDSTGFTFLPFLQWLLNDRMQTTKSSAFFMLSVIFVGHKIDGTTETISTCNAIYSLMTAECEVNHSGSTYVLEFNDTGISPQHSGSGEHLTNIGTISSVTSKDRQDTLGGMLDSFEELLNVQSLRFYQKFKNLAFAESEDAARYSAFATTSSAEKFVAAGSTGRPGKLVQYMITLPQQWRDFKITSAKKSLNKESTFELQNGYKGPTEAERRKAGFYGMSVGEQQKFMAEYKKQQQDKQAAEDAKKAETKKHLTATGGEYSEITFNKSTNIPDAIKHILETSVELLQLSSDAAKKAGTAQQFSIKTSITSDDDTFLIHFDILPTYLERDVIKKPAERNSVKPGSSERQVVSSQQDPIVKNVIEYDYIFTGNNSHIKELKIGFDPMSVVALDTTMSIGRSRFATNAAEAGQRAAGAQSASQGVPASLGSAPLVRRGDPIFLPLRSKDQQMNNGTQKNENKTEEEAIQEFKAKQEYTITFAEMHRISSLNLELTVRGNPSIIKKYSDVEEKGGVAPHGKIITGEALRNISGDASVKNATETYIREVSKNLQTSKEQYYQNFIKPKIEAIGQAHRARDSLLNNIDTSTLPVFVKINIKTPNVDASGDFIKYSDFAADTPKFINEGLFFDGPYIIHSITTRISGDSFDHQMSLIPYTVDSPQTTSGSKPKTQV